MSTEKTTIAQLWEEYTVGLNGGPSIKELNERHGTRWRQYQGGRQVYHNHSLVYEEIERRIKKGSNKADAVAAVQVMMDDHTVHPESRKRGRQHSQFPLHKLAVELQQLNPRRRTHDSSTPVRNVCAPWCVSASVRACVRACVRASERARRVRCFFFERNGPARQGLCGLDFWPCLSSELSTPSVPLAAARALHTRQRAPHTSTLRACESA